MNVNVKFLWVSILLLGCFILSGCALLKLPFEILATILKVIQQVPKPPPGVIPGAF